MLKCIASYAYRNSWLSTYRNLHDGMRMLILPYTIKQKLCSKKEQRNVTSQISHNPFFAPLPRSVHEVEDVKSTRERDIASLDLFDILLLLELVSFSRMICLFPSLANSPTRKGSLSMRRGSRYAGAIGSPFSCRSNHRHHEKELPQGFNRNLRFLNACYYTRQSLRLLSFDVSGSKHNTRAKKSERTKTHPNVQSPLTVRVRNQKQCI